MRSARWRVSRSSPGAPDPRGLPPRRALDARVLPHVLAFARQAGAPVRVTPSHHVGSFYGQWAVPPPRTHRGRGLAALLTPEVREGVTEPIVPPRLRRTWFRSSYLMERDSSCRTLCDPACDTRSATGNPAVGFPRSAGAPDRHHREGGGEMSTGRPSRSTRSPASPTAVAILGVPEYALGLAPPGVPTSMARAAAPCPRSRAQTHVISTSTSG